jgi:glycosyltransferase involved in cell wall biosynthesis
MSWSGDKTIEVFFLMPSKESRGGIGRLAHYLEREFRSAGTDVRLRIVPTRWSERRILKHISTIPALVSFLGKCAIASHRIVHINVAPRGSTYRKYLFWLAARACRTKTILHLHGSGYDQFFRTQKPALQRIIRRFFLGADRVVVLGKYWKDFVAGEIGVSRERISIIGNGVPEPKPSTEAKWEPPLIATMGLVGERKGTDVLIEALAGLPGSMSWRAVVGGNGEVEKYRSLAEAAGVGSRIDFLGWVDEADVDQWLNRASVFVLPSRAENQPVAILEAMARGVPVIATSVGAIPEQVIQGVTGLLVPPGEVEPLRVGIQNLLLSHAVRTSMGAAARQRFKERFSIASCATALESVYQSLTDEPLAVGQID